MKEQVNREVCVTILDSPHATDIEKKLAGICLLLLDECESLRKDKERLTEQVEAFRSFMETEMGWEYFRAEMMYFDNEKKERCSLENARKLKNFLAQNADTQSIGSKDPASERGK